MPRQDRGKDWATMGHDKGFPYRDIVPLTSCHDTESVSRQDSTNKRASARATYELCRNRELSVATDFP